MSRVKDNRLLIYKQLQKRKLEKKMNGEKTDVVILTFDRFHVERYNADSV